MLNQGATIERGNAQVSPLTASTVVRETNEATSLVWSPREEGQEVISGRPKRSLGQSAKIFLREIFVSRSLFFSRTAIQQVVPTETLTKENFPRRDILKGDTRL